MVMVLEGLARVVEVEQVAWAEAMVAAARAAAARVAEATVVEATAHQTRQSSTLALSHSPRPHLMLRTDLMLRRQPGCSLPSQPPPVMAWQWSPQC